MSARGLSREAMLTSLQDIRLPAEAAGGLWAEIAVVVGLAGALALCILGAVRLVTSKATRSENPTLSEQLRASAALPEAARRVALLHLLKEHAPAKYAALRPQLYRRQNPLDLATLEAEVAHLV